MARVAGIVMVVLGLGLAGWGLFELTRPASVGDTARELERFARAMYGFQAITGGLGLAFMGGVLAGIGGIQQSIGRWAAWHAHATR